MGEARALSARVPAHAGTHHHETLSLHKVAAAAPPDASLGGHGSRFEAADDAGGTARAFMEFL